MSCDTGTQPQSPAPRPEAAWGGQVEFPELASKGVMSGKSAFVTFNLFKREILFSEEQTHTEVKKAELLVTTNGEN